MVAYGILRRNLWNANEQTPAMQARLKTEIVEVGFLEALVVVPMPDGTMRILGGEHRWIAAGELGLPEVPCIVLRHERFQDEETQKALTVRLNRIRGKTNPTKMAALLHEFVAKRSVSEVRHLFAVTDDDAWREMVAHTREALVASGVSPDAAAEYDKAAKKARTVDDLQKIVARLYETYGAKTADFSFAIFSFAGREHIWVGLREAPRAALVAALAAVQEAGLDAGDALEPYLLRMAADLSKHADQELPL